MMYYLPEQGESKDDARSLPESWGPISCRQDFACEVAMYRHHQDPCSKDVVVAVIEDNGNTSIWDVRGEPVISFTAYRAEVKP